MKVKMIYAHSYHQGEDRVNDFIKGKKILNIKFAANYVRDEDHYAFMILYED